MQGLDNWHVIGHEWAVRGLAHSLAIDRAAHAYLFTGPHGIGKTTLALALAQALECTGAPAPCGECGPCRQIARNRHPDVQVIEGVPVGYKFDGQASPPPRANDRERRILKIDQIRLVQHDLSRAPFQSRWKIAILRRFEEANDEAANAFLKTLEEPPAHARLLLTARDASLLLPTIASRCQVLALRPLPVEQVEQALCDRWQVDAQTAHLDARLSNGRLGWAVRASADPTLLLARTAHLDVLTDILCEGRAERLTRAGDLAKDAENLLQMLEEWVGWWRDVLLMQTQRGAQARITNVDRAERLREQATAFSLGDVHSALQQVRMTIQYLNQNVNSRLALETLLLGLPRQLVY